MPIELQCQNSLPSVVATNMAENLLSADNLQADLDICLYVDGDRYLVEDKITKNKAQAAVLFCDILGACYFSQVLSILHSRDYTLSSDSKGRVKAEKITQDGSNDIWSRLTVLKNACDLQKLAGFGSEYYGNMLKNKDVVVEYSRNRGNEYYLVSESGMLLSRHDL